MLGQQFRCQLAQMVGDLKRGHYLLRRFRALCPECLRRKADEPIVVEVDRTFDVFLPDMGLVGVDQGHWLQRIVGESW